ncbi:MAG: hypothetical protein WD872_02595 [Pirellulaceae bacterium]
MRRTILAVVLFFCTGGGPALFAQADSPQARALRAQLDEVQRQLDDLARRESSTRKVTEIGSARGATRDDDEPRMVVRVYDLGDLFSIAPKYPAREPEDLLAGIRNVFPQAEMAASGVGGGGMGGGGMGGLFSVPSSGNRPAPAADQKVRPDTLHQMAGGLASEQAAGFHTSVDRLIQTITTVISPEEWDQLGGPSSITSLGASLIVSAPADMHDQIGALIDLFRQRWGSLRTVSIEAHWLWLTAEQLAAREAPPANEVDDEPTAFGVLSDASWARLREQSRAHAQQRTGYHAVLTCYNGQTVHALAGRQHLVVTGMTPVVGGESEPAYQIQTRVVLDGAALQVTPIVSRTAKFVVVDVHSRVNLLGARGGEMAAQPANAEARLPADSVQLVDSLDRPELDSQRLSTTVRMPVGRPMLVGGMTFAAPGADNPNLYLFLTTHVQELRDDEPAETELQPAADDAAKLPEEDVPAKPE